MWLQYIFAGLLITALFVYTFRKFTNKKANFSPRRRARKTQLIRSETGLTMDDHFRLGKKQKELEINGLLEKVKSRGYDNLSQKEKQRLKDLSDSL